jgi:hypothetical protein
MWRSVLWVIAIALTAGVGYVAVDAARRLAATSKTFTQGMGTPDNPSPKAQQEAEWNLVYLLGLTVGVASGASLVVAAGLVLRLLRKRPSEAEQNAADVT